MFASNHIKSNQNLVLTIRLIAKTILELYFQLLLQEQFILILFYSEVHIPDGRAGVQMNIGKTHPNLHSFLGKGETD